MRKPFFAGVVSAVLVACASKQPEAASMPPTQPAPPASEKECDELVRSAIVEVRAAKKGRDSCTTDADCGYANFYLSCDPVCPGMGGASANKSALADIEATRRRVDEKQCAEFTARGCKPRAQDECRRSMPPECERGKCY